MPIIVAESPRSVPVFSGFDYVTVDETRHRVYAAHTASKRLLIVDANDGKVTGQVDVGPMHGVAVDPETGDVFTGNGTDRTVSKVDPVAMKVIATVDVPGEVDAIAYDPGLHRIYADQDNGSSIFVIDGRTMKHIATIATPSSDLESPAVDPTTHAVYQNFADMNAFAIIDPKTLRIVKIVKTPQIQDNHPLVFATGAQILGAGGKNGIFSTYTPGGVPVANGTVQTDIDQCSTGSKGHIIACAGRGIISVVAVAPGKAPTLLAKIDTGHPIHTVGIDESTGDLWVVWSDATGDYVQRLHWENDAASAF
jgi:DNA-binding beta-propeller fold protein YncE